MRKIAAVCLFAAGFAVAALIDDWIVRIHPNWIGLERIPDEPGGGWQW